MTVPYSAPLMMKIMYVHQIDDMMLAFCVTLTSVVKAFHSQVKEALPEPTASDCHSFVPGDFIYIKSHKRKTRTPAKVD